MEKNICKHCVFKDDDGPCIMFSKSTFSNKCKNMLPTVESEILPLSMVIIACIASLTLGVIGSIIVTKILY